MLAAHLGLSSLVLKDDTGLPSGSLKDRAAAVAVARARQLGLRHIACASTGNLSAAVAAAGIPVFAWKGETLEAYWWCTLRAMTWQLASSVLTVGGGIAGGLLYDQALVPDMELEHSASGAGAVLALEEESQRLMEAGAGWLERGRLPVGRLGGGRDLVERLETVGARQQHIAPGAGPCRTPAIQLVALDRCRQRADPATLLRRRRIGAAGQRNDDQAE